MRPKQIRIREADHVALTQAAENHQTDAVSILRSLSARADELMWLLKLLRLANDSAYPQRITLAVRALTATQPGEVEAAACQLADALANHPEEPEASALARAAIANLAILRLIRSP